VGKQADEEIRGVWHLWKCLASSKHSKSVSSTSAHHQHEQGASYHLLGMPVKPINHLTTEKYAKEAGWGVYSNNHSYSRDRHKEDHSLRPAQVESMRLYGKKKLKGLGCDSSGRERL
jgi:hypothetical protein